MRNWQGSARSQRNPRGNLQYLWGGPTSLLFVFVQQQSEMYAWECQEMVFGRTVRGGEGRPHPLCKPDVLLYCFAWLDAHCICLS